MVACMEGVMIRMQHVQESWVGPLNTGCAWLEAKEDETVYMVCHGRVELSDLLDCLPTRRAGASLVAGQPLSLEEEQQMATDYAEVCYPTMVQVACYWGHVDGVQLVDVKDDRPKAKPDGVIVVDTSRWSAPTGDFVDVVGVVAETVRNWPARNGSTDTVPNVSFSASLRVKLPASSALAVIDGGLGVCKDPAVAAFSSLVDESCVGVAFGASDASQSLSVAFKDGVIDYAQQLNGGAK